MHILIADEYFPSIGVLVTEKLQGQNNTLKGHNQGKMNSTSTKIPYAHLCLPIFPLSFIEIGQLFTEKLCRPKATGRPTDRLTD